MKHKNKYLLVVAGPTAVGKTDFSIRLAEKFGAEIISADSRQLYQKLDIGTAKPSPVELAAVPHHFIDILPLDKEYNAGLFEQDALKVAEKLFTQNDFVVMAGGSGMYVQALCHGMDEMPSVPKEIRENLNARLEKEGLPQLFAELEFMDTEYASQVDRNNPQRVVRALEVCLYSGKTYSSYRKQQHAPRPFHTIKIGLDRPREELYQRIDQRMDLMIEMGLFKEATELFPHRKLNALQTVGYKEIFEYLEGGCSKEEAVRLLKRNSRHYAKRQLTWFRKDPEYQWFHPEAFEEALEYIRFRTGEEKGVNGL